MNDRGPGNVSFRLLAIAVVLFFSARSTGAIEGAGRQAVATALDEAQVEQTLSELHDRYRGLDDGEVYRSGSEPVDPDLFGIAVTTVDGLAYEVGDANVPFPIQSIAKPFVFGLALADHGPEIMLEKVGVNATGLPYNSIIASNVRAQSLQNPMVSAGALATASLVKGSTEEEKWDRVRLTFAHYAGHELPFNEAVYEILSKVVCDA